MSSATKKWKNQWGNVQCKPKKIRLPATEHELVETVKYAATKQHKMRPAGNGHALAPLAETGNELIWLKNYTGITHINHNTLQVTALAGTPLTTLAHLLFEQGLALQNTWHFANGQTIAGAISTGEHGTGLAFGNIATQVTALTLVTAQGQVIQCSNTANPAIFKAAMVSMGTVGVISTVTLQCVPAYKLQYSCETEDLNSCLSNLNTYIANTRNFEFSWYPYTKTCQTRFVNTTSNNTQTNTTPYYLNGMALENSLINTARQLTRLMPALSGKMAHVMALQAGNVNATNWSHLIYPAHKTLAVHETAFFVPHKQLKEVMLEVIDCIDHYRFKSLIAVECRFVKADDIYLSPAYGQDSACITFQANRAVNYKPCFNAMESICQNHSGRPHWSKLHTFTAKNLQPLYPQWQQFLSIRRQTDPSGLFLNGYLRQLFGLESPLSAG